MYAITAKLFAEIAEEVTKRFGSEGEDAIRKAVRNFGEKRGKKIAENAIADGKTNTPENYLKYYDMERSALFECDSTVTPECVDQCYHVCPFAAAWLADGTEKYGMMYCDEVDGAIAHGYNPDFVHKRFTHLLRGDNCCRMSFKMKR